MNVDLSVPLSVWEHAHAMRTKRELGNQAAQAGGLSERFEALRELYRLERPYIDAGQYNPYPTDWLPLMSPIEQDVWFSIRVFGVRMYPQFPIGRYFADFAEPWQRIVIECDGAAFHTDKAKDARRANEIRAQGWRVIRIPGSACVLPESDPLSSHWVIGRLVGRYWEPEEGDGESS